MGPEIFAKKTLYVVTRVYETFFLWEFRWISHTKGQQRGKMFPFDDVIMRNWFSVRFSACPVFQRGRGRLYTMQGMLGLSSLVVSFSIRLHRDWLVACHQPFPFHDFHHLEFSHLLSDFHTSLRETYSPLPWASYQRRKIVGCSCAGPIGTFSRHRGLAIPPCIATRASRTCRDACRDR